MAKHPRYVHVAQDVDVPYENMEVRGTLRKSVNMHSADYYSILESHVSDIQHVY